MALITFKNLPDTSTPINSTNLNNNFTECNNIIASGSNANGNYIKYSDGTMICWQQIEGAEFNCSQSGGTGRYYYQDTNNSAENSKQWTFPQVFNELPVVNCNVGSSAYSCTSIGTLSKTIVAAYCVLPYPVNPTKFIWYFTAIGKWK